MLNNVQIWVGGIWRRLIGLTNQGEKHQGHVEGSRAGKAAHFCHVKVILVNTDYSGVHVSCVC